MLLQISGIPGLNGVHRTHLCYSQVPRQGQNGAVTGAGVGAGMDGLSGKISWGKEEKGSQKFAFRRREGWIENGNCQCQGLVGRGVWGVRVSPCSPLQGRRGGAVCLYQVSYSPFSSLSCFDSSWPCWPFTFSSLSSRGGSQIYPPTGPSLCSPGQPCSWLLWGSSSQELGP